MNWIIPFLLLWTSLSAKSQVGVCPSEAKNHSIAETEQQTREREIPEEQPQVVIIDRSKKKVSHSESILSEAPPKRVNPLRNGRGVLPVVNIGIDEEYTDDDCYDSDYCWYEPDSEYEECYDARPQLKKWLVPAAAVGGIIGTGVCTAIKNPEDCPRLHENPVGDLYFEFDYEFSIFDTNADIDFEIRLPNDTVFESFMLGAPVTNLQSSTISNVFAGDQYTVVATDYDGSFELDVTFTMRAYLNGVLFDTQVLNYVGQGLGNPAVPPAPQTFTFTIPSS